MTGAGPQEAGPRKAAAQESAPPDTVPPKAGLSAGPGPRDAGHCTSGPRNPEPKGPSPRNPWPRATAALEAARAGRIGAARDALEQLRYHPHVPAGVFALLTRRLETIAAGLPATIERPADYLMQAGPGSPLRPPLRLLQAGRRPPAPYPPTLALPPHVGAGNDTGFLRDAALALAADFARRPCRVQVLIDARPGTPLPRLIADLARQTYDGPLAVTVFGPGADVLPDAPGGLALDRVPAALADPAAGARLAALTGAGAGPGGAADLLLILSGDVGIDPTLVARAVFWGRVSERLVQPLVPAEGALSAVLPGAAPRWTGSDPHRGIRGLNMALPAPLLRRAGQPEARFAGPLATGREFGYRLGLLGAWFAPLAVPRLDPGPAVPGAGAEEADARLYAALCPEAGHPRDPAEAERPRVSVYIPAYNAARYLRRAVDSVLEQDVSDLEVCICDDGSTDATPDLLARHYAAEPRVRWQRHRNGGIGFGSNRAIAMARAPYIGQLDSDDALKPGAVRRLAEHLDSHPETVCAYGSCERIDAEGAYVRDEYRWPVFSREKMMITSITHHFRMFRRAAWERTATFREDIVNGIDYDIFLKLSELGPFHHIDELLYQRRWHGENTSMVNEAHQTANTHRAQTEALKRMGLARFWEVHAPDPAEPRRVTYRTLPGVRRVLSWPPPGAGEAYRPLLYGATGGRLEICTGDLAAAAALLAEGAAVTFHLHGPGPAEEAGAFLATLRGLVARGLRLVWSPGQAVPARGCDPAGIAALAHAIHLHHPERPAALAGLPPWPAERLAVTAHGPAPLRGPDLLDRAGARAALGLAAAAPVVLCPGLTPRGARALALHLGPLCPGLRLVLTGAGTRLGEGPAPQTGTDGARDRAGSLAAGAGNVPSLAAKSGPARPRESGTGHDALHTLGRAPDEADWPLLARAADAVFWGAGHPPSLTEVVAAVQAGLPVVAPACPVLRAHVPASRRALLYGPGSGEAGRAAALLRALSGGDAPEPPVAAAVWPDLGALLRGPAGS